MLLAELALAPAIAIAIYFYYRDKYEKEPLNLLLAAFICGFLSTILVIIIQMPLIGLIKEINNFIAKIFLESFVGAGIIEEGTKFMIFMLLIYKNKEFNEPYDAILYAVMISLGFAAFENVGYVLGAYLKGGMVLGFSTVLLRALLSVPAHALFAVIMGYYLGIAKFSQDTQAESRNISKALGVAIVMHGFFDFFLFLRVGVAFFYLMISFIILWRIAFRDIRIQLDKSPFKPKK